MNGEIKYFALYIFKTEPLSGSTSCYLFSSVNPAE